VIVAMQLASSACLVEKQKPTLAFDYRLSFPSEATSPLAIVALQEQKAK